MMEGVNMTISYDEGAVDMTISDDQGDDDFTTFDHRGDDDDGMMRSHIILYLVIIK